MKKRKILLLIPLLVIAAFLIDCWITILTTDIIANWRHYFALILFFILIYFYFKNFKLSVIATGLYLLLGTFNLLSMDAELSAYWFKVGVIETMPLQLLSLGIFVIFIILNFDTLIDIYLDYKESKK